MAKVKTREASQPTLNKVRFNFDVPMLNSLLSYTQCEYVPRSDLYNMKKLFNYTDPELYRAEQPIYIRLCTIQSVLKSMLDLGLANQDLIKSELRTDFEPGLMILDDLGFEKNQLVVSECEYISKFISEKLQYIEIYQKRESS